MLRTNLRTAAFAAFAAAAVVAAASPADELTPQTPLPPRAIPAYAQPLPVLSVSQEALWEDYPRIQTVFGNAPLTLRMCEFPARVLPAGTFAPGVQPATWVWGYVAAEECPSAPRDTYIGPVVVNARGTPTPIRFVNALPESAGDSQVIAYRDGVDQTLHWADPEELMCAHAMGEMDEEQAERCASPFRGSIPAVPHLHGGEVPPYLDGGPDAWFTSDGEKQGPGYFTSAAAAAHEAVYAYPNSQEAGPLWFHDHTLGATRLNVYAGLAGGYVLTDPQQDVPAALKNPANVVPLVLQDRMFDTNGQLFFTSGSKGGVLWALNPEHPYWNPEFVGDVIAVNGKVWPYLEVEPKRYRFLFLNGSNARTYELFLTDRVTKALGPAMYVVATDGGFLDAAVKIDPATKVAPTKLVLMPGERYEVVIDFAGLPPGTRLWLRNVAKTPYPAGAAPTGGLMSLMELRVAGAVTSPGLDWNPALTPAIRGTPMPKLVDFATGTLAATASRTRQLTLNEVMGMPQTAIDPVTETAVAFPGGPLEVLVNNTKWSGEITETPREGDTELWELVNLTADSHPMHLHLVQFQVLNRQAFDARRYGALYEGAFPAVLGDDGAPVEVGMVTCSGGVYCPGSGPPYAYDADPDRLGGNPDVAPYLRSAPQPAALQERGWKDTVQVPPGMVTRLAVRFAPTDLPVTTPPELLRYPFDPSGVVGDQQFGYVWHCHIIDHEDNEMMRPYVVERAD